MRKSNSEKQLKSTSATEIFTIIGAVLSIVICVTLVTNGVIFGQFGTSIMRFVTGIFGYSAYPIFIACLLFTIATLFKKRPVLKAKYIVALLLVFLSGILALHLFTTKSLFKEETITFSSYISSCYNASKNGLSATTGGGAFFAMLVYPLAKYITVVGSFIVFASIFVASALVACDFLFIKRAKRDKFGINQVDDYDLHNQNGQESMHVDNMQARNFNNTNLQKGAVYFQNGIPVYVPENYMDVVEGRNLVNQEIETKRYVEPERKPIQTLQVENLNDTRAEQGLFVGTIHGKNTFEKRSRRDVKNNAMKALNMPYDRTAVPEYINHTRDEAKELLFSHSGVGAPRASENVQRDRDRSIGRDVLFRGFPASTSYVDNFERNPIKDIPKTEYILKPPTFTELYPDVTKVAKPMEESKRVFNENARSSAPKNLLGGTLYSRENNTDYKYDANEEMQQKNATSKNLDIIDGDKYTRDKKSGVDVILPNNYNSDVVNFSEFAKKKQEVEFDSNKDNLNEYYNADDHVPNDEKLVVKIEKTKEEPKKLIPIKQVKYDKPYVDLLDEYNESIELTELDYERAEILEGVFEEFSLPAAVKNIIKGPMLTQFELEMPRGEKVRKITDLIPNLKMRLRAEGAITIEAPVPGKDLFGVQIQNKTRTSIGLRGIIDSDEFQSSKSPLTVAVGRDVSGNAVITDLEKMPHLLVAGSTGSGKSVCLNALILSLLYKASPEEVKLLLIDPKQVEFIKYKGLPHMLIESPITDMNNAVKALEWAVLEMNRRYSTFKDAKVGNIEEFNSSIDTQYTKKMPYIVLIIDEFAEMIIYDRHGIEDSIKSLSSKARAAGIHLIVATQRPSKDVVIGTIKNNFMYRMAFAVSDADSSRTILGGGGAEDLYGKGDMLFRTIDQTVRVQCCNVKGSEINSVINHILDNNDAIFDESLEDEMFNRQPKEMDGVTDGDTVATEVEEYSDPLLKKALKYAIENQSVTPGLIQARFPIGYTRAVRIVNEMVDKGYVEELPFSALPKTPRSVLIGWKEFYELFGGDEKM